MEKNTHFISVPLDLGANIEGSSGGPEALEAYLTEEKFAEEKKLQIKQTKLLVPPRNSSSAKNKYKEEITDTCKTLKKTVKSSLLKEEIPVTLGGDHSIAIGSIFGAQSYCYEKGLKLGVVWLDAHADMNTPESSETGNIHGMPLATVLGMGHESLISLGKPAPFIEGERVYLGGIRDVDEKEQVILDQSGVHYATMTRIKETSAEAIVAEIKNKVLDHVDCLHLSFDLDAMDPEFAPSVSTPVKKGMTLEEAEVILTALKDSGKLLSLDLVEYNPLNEVNEKGLATSKKLLSYILP